MPFSVQEWKHFNSIEHSYFYIYFEVFVYFITWGGLQNCKYVEIRRRKIWIVILGLKKPVIKKLFHVSSTSTFRAVFLILINITKILNNLLGSNIEVWKVLLYTFHNSKRTFVVQLMEHYILNVEHIYLLLTALQFSVCITVSNSNVFIGTEQIRWTLKKFFWNS